MSDRRTDRDVNQALTSWMGEVAPQRAPTRLLEETFARTTGTGQARAYPWHKLPVGRLGLGTAEQRDASWLVVGRCGTGRLPEGPAYRRAGTLTPSHRLTS